MRPVAGGSWARRTYAASVVAFAGALAALGMQVQAGADPSIGMAKAAPAAPTPPRPRVVITRRIVKTTVVTKKIVRRAPAAVAAPVYASSGAAPAPSAGYASPAQAAAPAAAPAAAAAAPAPAPAAAPAPAPVTSAS